MSTAHTPTRPRSSDARLTEPDHAGVGAAVDSALACVAFTGRLAALSRRDAAERVAESGGRIVRSVSRRTTLLVVGANGLPILPDGTISRALRRAEELNESGARVRIVSEPAFLEMIGLGRERDGRSALPKAYSFDEVCELLGLAAVVLRRWVALGLIESHDEQFDFQDIVSLQAIAGLVATGVPLATIAASVRGLARVLPNVERPLAQLRLVESSGTLLAELGDVVVAPDGQFVLDFDAERDAGPLASIGAAAAVRPDAPTADDWFAAAIEHEEREDLEAAARAYRRALESRPGFAIAHFNLGNVLRHLGRLDGAEAHFFTAATLDRELAEAWYNLADVQEELGRTEDGIESLHRALEVSPRYADAHWNLALFHESLDQRDAARRHWDAYLRLDPTSEWAADARRRLEG